MDPYYISSTTVPTTAQPQTTSSGWRRRSSTEKNPKESILRLYTEIEEGSMSDMEKDIACEDTDRFIHSSTNLAQVADIFKCWKTR